MTTDIAAILMVTVVCAGLSAIIWANIEFKNSERNDE